MARQLAAVAVASPVDRRVAVDPSGMGRASIAVDSMVALDAANERIEPIRMAWKGARTSHSHSSKILW